jgi:hypothetical protein
MMQTLREVSKQYWDKDYDRNLPPANSKDSEQSDLLSPHKLQLPDISHRQSSYQEICHNVKDTMGISSTRNTGKKVDVKDGVGKRTHYR